MIGGMRTVALRYGDHPSQRVEAWTPEGAPAPPLAIVIHGGWWRAKHDLHLMDGICAALAARGWLACNLEFRRIDGDGGGWPQTLGDVRAAIDMACGSLPHGGAAPAAVGHSAGGQLALLAAAAGALRGVVALAPLTDLARCAREGLGEGATPVFMGGPPEVVAGAYRAASPLHRLPVGGPVLVVHGDADVRVPVAHARDYVAAARAAGDDVEYREVAGLDHFRVIDASWEGWDEIHSWLDERRPAP
jgi:acetyl esterase/lipase